ncbi:D-isomer specific 2-hydroxyacid dehydrogenase [Paractinoplanes abujensis]|uniref:Phosphoglycerate dehydrogenase-like enzyme n=1 Tax=Paractinoplanes abujensis TaxID=882441 RepID=A0A7W7CLB2_9ACTN|nr:NAD(P)-dependent oxidoreductase [Actinoplanes abujensis]MBB4690409.1 phosphoglycerate dehydrogenase-like enzyme [Actinoplanes abujensis]GID21173.1 D-isomer specific 2-hydroxyacid dehydrogenase [Actinoplanes abujensis]
MVFTHRSSGKILVTGDSTPSSVLTMIEERHYEVRLVPDHALNPEELHAALIGIRGYLIGGEEVPTTEHFEQATALEAVAFLGTDFRAHVPGWQRAFELGIAFANTPGTNATAVAEHTIRLLLTLARPLPPGPLGDELGGRTLGIVGAGRIGSRVARTAALGFGMRVIYAAPRRNEPLEAALGMRHVSIEELISESDAICLHRPGPAEGEPPLLGALELGGMRTGAMLVNTGHPRLVDPSALAEAIEAGRIKAAFDGLGKGPEWKHLESLDPHRFVASVSTAYRTHEANLRSSSAAAQAVCDVLDGLGSPLVNNPDHRERRAQP